MAVNFDCSKTNPCNGIVLDLVDLTHGSNPATASCTSVVGSVTDNGEGDQATRRSHKLIAFDYFKEKQDISILFEAENCKLRYLPPGWIIPRDTNRLKPLVRAERCAFPNFVVLTPGLHYDSYCRMRIQILMTRTSSHKLHFPSALTVSHAGLLPSVPLMSTTKEEQQIKEEGGTKTPDPPATLASKLT
ncbi:hypothetical protein Sjap_020359 [Stephania japonica]|uniref:Uncharacterized protein n=1 Tax=Stephania japonica TaxID=461633 RepID=A0AAP0F0H7_9MAGN